MAELKVGFVTFNPGSGNGDQAVTVSGDKYKGRVERSITTQVATNDSSVQKQVVVNQSGVTEYVVIDETASVAKGGGEVTINGTSNSTKLTFSLAQDESHPLVLTIPENYTAAGKPTANGAAIADDPGATGEYQFSITFSGIATNTTVSNLITNLTVTAAGGQSDSTVITQTAGDPTLEVDKTVINLDAKGTAQTLNITSNTDWTISQVVSKMFKAMTGK